MDYLKTSGMCWRVGTNATLVISMFCHLLALMFVLHDFFFYRTQNE